MVGVKEMEGFFKLLHLFFTYGGSVSENISKGSYLLMMERMWPVNGLPIWGLVIKEDIYNL
jgi:hypothetical protein